MDNPCYMFSNMMGKATAMMVCCMFTVAFEKELKAEREKVKAALGNEPTQENWQDYYDLLKEQKIKQKASQREADKGKLRRLVMGDADGSSAAG